MSSFGDIKGCFFLVNVLSFILDTIFKLVITITIPCLFAVRVNVDIVSFSFSVIFIPWP